LGTKLLFSTAYYLQTDRVSEHTNQTIEIALYYYIAILEQLHLWPEVLPWLSTALSNSTSQGTGQPGTVVIYRFRICEPLDIIAQQIVDIADGPVRENFLIPVYPVEPAKVANY
jgi:hypothetical protein